MIQTTYDIVKAHGRVPIATSLSAGTVGIKVETKENEGTIFIIQLPTA